MLDAIIAHLSSTPWCKALIDSPDWEPVRISSRTPKPTTEDSFLAETLATDRTIRNCLALRPRKKLETKNGLEDMAYGEVMTLMEVGDGINGHPQVAHGGFVATMLDEVMGMLITLNIEARVRRKKELGVLGPHEAMNCFTAYLNTSYKKPVATPGVVLCTARFEKREGSKIYLRGTVEDGSGTVYTTAEAMFVEVNKKPRL